MSRGKDVLELDIEIKNQLTRSVLLDIVSLLPGPRRRREGCPVAAVQASLVSSYDPLVVVLSLVIAVSGS